MPGLQDIENLQSAATTGQVPLTSLKPLERILQASRGCDQAKAAQANVEALLEAKSSQTSASEFSSAEQAVIRKAVMQAELFDQQQAEAEDNAPYQHPATQKMKQVREKEPYLDRFTRLVAMQLAERLDDVRFRQDALEMGTLRRDNFVLARYVQVLLQQNKAVEEENERLKKELEAFKPTLGGLYRKTASNLV